MRTEIINTPGWYEMHFDSPLDMLDLKASTTTNESQMKGNQCRGGIDWTKSTNYEQFKGMMRGGAGVFMHSMMQKAAQITVTKPVAHSLINVVKRKRIDSDTGDELDYDKWRRGDVDTAWRTTKRFIKEEKRRRAACLFVNVTANGHIDADEFEWRGAALVRLAELLSSAGWATEIVVGMTSTGSFQQNRDRLGITFVAKPSTMPLSLERVALQTSAAWFRYCTFGAMTSNEQKLDVTWGLGHADPTTIPPYVLRMVDRGYKLLQIPSGTWWKEAAQAAVDQAIKEVQELDSPGQGVARRAS